MCLGLMACQRTCPSTHVVVALAAPAGEGWSVADGERMQGGREAVTFDEATHSCDAVGRVAHTVGLAERRAAPG